MQYLELLQACENNPCDLTPSGEKIVVYLVVGETRVAHVPSFHIKLVIHHDWQGHHAIRRASSLVRSAADECMPIATSWHDGQPRSWRDSLAELTCVPGTTH